MKRALTSVLLCLCAAPAYAQTTPGSPTPKTVEFLYKQIVKAESSPDPKFINDLIAAALQSPEVINEVRSEAENGNAHAQDVLATCYAKGWGGLPQNNVKASAWYRKATDLGDTDALQNLQRLQTSGGSLAPLQLMNQDRLTNDENRSFSLIKIPEGLVPGYLSMGENHIYGVLIGDGRGSSKREIFKIGDGNSVEIMLEVPEIPRGTPSPYTSQHSPLPVTLYAMPRLYQSKNNDTYGCIDTGQQPFTFGMLFQLKGGQSAPIFTGYPGHDVGDCSVVLSSNNLYFSSRDSLGNITLNSISTEPDQKNSERALLTPQNLQELTPIASDSQGGIYYQVEDRANYTTIYRMIPSENGNWMSKVVYKTKAADEIVQAYFLLGQLYIVHEPFAPFAKQNLTTISRVTSEGNVINIATASVDPDQICLVATRDSVYIVSSLTHQYGQIYKISGNDISVVHNFSASGGATPRAPISTENGICGIEDGGFDGNGGIFCYNEGHFQQIAKFPENIGRTFTKRIYGIFKGRIIGTASSLLKNQSYIFEIPLQNNSINH